MNLLEAKYLSGLEDADTETIAKYFISQGVKEVYITLGKDGSLFMNKNEVIKTPSHDVEILNTAGAGDAYLAGILYAKVHGFVPTEYAQKAAMLTLRSEKAVSTEMNIKNLEETV